MPDNFIPIAGLVLTGGMSERMGTDKSQIIYYDRPQGLYIYDLLSCYCTKTLFSIKDPAVELNYPVVADKYDFGGPLNGILSAMANFPGFAVLSVPCDMPDINGYLIQTLIQEHDESYFATCYKNKDQVEPLFTLWQPSAFKLLYQQVQENNLSPMHFLKNYEVKNINVPVSFVNINTAEERDNYIK